LYIGTADAFEIGVYTVDGTALRPIRDTITARAVTRADIERFVEEHIVGRTAAARRTRRTVLEGLQYPTHLPAYGALEVDDDDNLWVEEYRTTSDSRQRWRVYSPAGAFLSSVSMPAGFGMLEAGRDYVLGLETDGDGVELVRMYRLTR
ncbi:MAG TPA: hypothetical protein VFM38_08860, partial [Candidatus Limnocylindrales bacterium]|nr:hypothetical protein [Candidatus Limnocylindrales bacterium]